MSRTKEECIKTLEAIPEDLVSKAYTMDLIENTLQMDYSSDSIKKTPNLKLIKINENGFAEFSLLLGDGEILFVTMT